VSVNVNPYAEELGERDAVEVIRETPVRLERVLDAMSEEEIEARPAPGKWSVREVVAHLADCEIAFGFRLRQAAAGVEPGIYSLDDGGAEEAGGHPSGARGDDGVDDRRDDGRA